MKLISWNINGIRSIYNKGFLKWFEKVEPEILCLQEIKANKKQINTKLIHPKNYLSYFNSAKKKGYSGVAIYIKNSPLEVKNKLGIEKFDREGRILILHFDNFILINLYLPHGGRKKENLNYKLEVYSVLLNYLEKLKNKNIILIGDFNIAHKEIDLARPKENKNNIMFTEGERKQIDKLLNLGFIDTFRKLNPEDKKYTWWPYFANARQRNLGWRIDYVFISKTLLPKLKNAFILTEVKGSDHCPIGINIDVKK